MKSSIDHRDYADCCVRQCREPHVMAKYGLLNGVANVTVYQCKRCKYGVKQKWIDGYICIYGKEENESKL